jgi:hypothetical protein
MLKHEKKRYLIIKKMLIMSRMVIFILFISFSLSPVFAQQRGSSYEYRCSECGFVWYKSVGGYSKCQNSSCENSKAGRGSTGVKIK